MEVKEEVISNLERRITELQQECESLKRICADLQEEKQEEKQDSPRTPLQIKEENAKEEIDTPSKMGAEKNRKGRLKRVFVKPSLDEVQAYLDRVGEDRFTAMYFWTYYDSRQWMMGSRSIRDWRRVLDAWIERENNKAARRKAQVCKPQQNIVTHRGYKPVDQTGAVSYLEYLKMKSLAPAPSPCSSEGES